MKELGEAMSIPRGCLAALCVLTIALGGCSTDSREPEDQDRIVDGAYCGFISRDLIKRIWGHTDVRVEGDQIGTVAERTRRPQECRVADDRATGQFVRVSVSEDSEDDAVTRKPAAGCERQRVATNWGRAATCVKQNSVRLVGRAPTEGRLIIVSYHPQRGAMDDAVKVAIAVAKTVNRNVDRYDKAD